MEIGEAPCLYKLNTKGVSDYGITIVAKFGEGIRASVTLLFYGRAPPFREVCACVAVGVMNSSVAKRVCPGTNDLRPSAARWPWLMTRWGMVGPSTFPSLSFLLQLLFRLRWVRRVGQTDIPTDRAVATDNHRSLLSVTRANKLCSPATTNLHRQARTGRIQLTVTATSTVIVRLGETTRILTYFIS